MLALVISFLISFAIGFLFLESLWPVRRAQFAHLPLKACLALPLGQGLTSCALFIWLLVYGRVSRAYIIVEVLVTVGLAIYVVLINRKGGRERSSDDEQQTLKLRYGWLFPVAFCLAVVGAGIVITLSIVQEPHGPWDGWAIYELRARSIFRGGSNWRDGFTSLIWWSHPDYPLLLSLSSVRSWLYAGREIAFAQSVATGLFALTTAGIICSALSTLRSNAQGFLAGIVLLSLGTFIGYGSSAYADVPLFSLFAATFVFYALHNRFGPKGTGFLILAGITTGLAAWTKNEGSLFIMATLLAHALVTLRNKGVRIYLKQLGFLLLGMLPVLALVLYFKTRVAPPSEIIASMGGASLRSKLLDYHRYSFIARSFLWQITYYSGRGVNLAYLLPIYLLCVGATLKYKRTIFQLGLTILLMLAGYSWVYLTSPYDLAFHVSTSIDRLLLQQWPGFVFLFFLMATTPEEAVTNRNRSAGTKV